MLKEIFGTLLVLTSILDAIKYTIQALKIQRVKTAKSMSRKFINFALLNDIIKLGYGCIILDWFIISSSILSLICMIHLWYIIYYFYAYRMRGCANFKRPSVLVYLWNSILPNKYRPRL
jgi:hypothetical protein